MLLKKTESIKFCRNRISLTGGFHELRRWHDFTKGWVS